MWKKRNRDDRRPNREKKVKHKKRIKETTYNVVKLSQRQRNMNKREKGGRWGL